MAKVLCAVSTARSGSTRSVIGMSTRLANAAERMQVAFSARLCVAWCNVDDPCGELGRQSIDLFAPRAHQSIPVSIEGFWRRFEANEGRIDCAVAHPAVEPAVVRSQLREG